MTSRIEFGIVVPQIGATWKEAERFARTAEDAGFDSLWVVDHLVGLPARAGILEAWTLLTALATTTTRIEVGAKVLCQSFRSPSLLAKMATSLDLVSGGRLRFLMGTGWLEAEYESFGYAFPSPAHRVEELEDAVKICRGMFDAGEEPFTYEGRHHRVVDVVNIPAPQRRIPIGVGAVGDRMLDLTARLADEWNTPAVILPRYEERRAVFDERVAEHGRQVRRSTQIVFAPGEEPLPPLYDMFHPDLGLRGSRQQMVERTGQLVEAGVEGFYGFVPDEAALSEMAELLPDLRALAG